MPEVTVWSQPDCQPCRLTKRWLLRRGVAFREVSLVDSPGDVERFRAAGLMSAPVVELSSGVAWSGFRPERLKEVL